MTSFCEREILQMTVVFDFRLMLQAQLEEKYFNKSWSRGQKCPGLNWR